MKGKPWSEQEQRTLISCYLFMVKWEQEGRKFNKAEIRRKVLPNLEGRSAGSYEMKCCNVSAAMAALGYSCWVKGYKPLPGYQKSLEVLVAEEIARLECNGLWIS